MVRTSEGVGTYKKIMIRIRKCRESLVHQLDKLMSMTCAESAVGNVRGARHIGHCSFLMSNCQRETNTTVNL